ncbi:hypothetical protein A2U01_0080171, partial [Trifolium medium]|nr:hypothetical protein [Trifolium medium]
LELDGPLRYRFLLFPNDARAALSPGAGATVGSSECFAGTRRRIEDAVDLSGTVADPKI